MTWVLWFGNVKCTFGPYGCLSCLYDIKAVFIIILNFLSFKMHLVILIYIISLTQTTKRAKVAQLATSCCMRCLRSGQSNSIPLMLKKYRPVSHFYFLSKTLECAIFDQLSSYLSQNDLIDPYQSGFKTHHSTETALLCVKEGDCSSLCHGGSPHCQS